MRHLIDPTDLTVAETEQIVALAEDIIANRAKYSEACRGKKLATLFYEPSTRTRLSFTAAMLELGGQVIGFSDANSSSVSKGETVADTVRVIRCFADIIAMRHFKEGAPLVASQYAGIPVINAGDGSHAHPTQTLTDLLTIKREKGRFDNMTIGFCGDLKFGRTVHSLIKALSRYSNIKVILIAPQEPLMALYISIPMKSRTRRSFLNFSPALTARRLFWYVRSMPVRPFSDVPMPIRIKTSGRFFFKRSRASSHALVLALDNSSLVCAAKKSVVPLSHVMNWGESMDLFKGPHNTIGVNSSINARLSS